MMKALTQMCRYGFCFLAQQVTAVLSRTVKQQDKLGSSIDLTKK